jgi:uncharacterized membrane protein YciS (DUF1049 family)
MMDYLDLGVASFIIIFCAGLAVILIVMLLYYVNYKYEEWIKQKQMKKEAQELHENLEQYRTPTESALDDEEIEYRY